MYSILIIEDDPAICSNMELILRSEGYNVCTSIDGQSGLARVREKLPDLILCDILMQGMDGLTLLDRLKNDSTLASIPFIFVTALSERVEVRRGMSAGADDYLTKPFSAEELISAVTGRLHRIETIRLHRTRNEFKKEHDTLRQLVTAREREVLLLVGSGATSKRIAEQLGISLRTAEVHRSNLMNKLGATNTAMLTRWAVIAEQM